MTRKDRLCIVDSVVKSVLWAFHEKDAVGRNPAEDGWMNW